MNEEQLRKPRPTPRQWLLYTLLTVLWLLGCGAILLGLLAGLAYLGFWVFQRLSGQGSSSQAAIGGVLTFIAVQGLPLVLGVVAPIVLLVLVAPAFVIESRHSEAAALWFFGQMLLVSAVALGWGALKLWPFVQAWLQQLPVLGF
ncbi:hypothetical protein [Leptolyngbya sp. FACHB-261]|uniref:hypothetical protein n=1 Tax=Leptolyngbya sp. FACHB-261 TaxID=2692806 RepID=UPI001686A6AC|nr:hypothetical protein [Leptolyngbya sp. FACHB-261]MBD2101274.1 hypothetical protein [Leptolyngbya sp. FACHB-261]